MHIETADGALRTVTRQDAYSGPAAMFSTGSGGSIPLLGLTTEQTYSMVYKTNPWVFAAVRAISLGMSRNSLGVYRWTDSGDRVRVRYDRPSDDFAGMDLDRALNGAAGRVGPQKRMRRTVVDFLVRGNALWEEVDNGFAHVPWRRVNPVLSADNEILGWQIMSSVPGQTRFKAPEEVVHFSGGDDPDSELGVSSIAALKYTLQLFEALQRHMVRFFENSARPSGNLKVEKGVDQEKMAYMREQFRLLYTNPENAGKVIITSGDFQPITSNADQTGLVDLVKLSREEIGSVYRIPLPVLGVLDNAIKSNVKELREQMTRDTLGGYSSIFEDEIRAQVVEPIQIYSGLFTEWDFDAQLRPDFEALAQTMTNLETTLTTDERRGLFNKPALDLPESKTVATTPGAQFLGVAPVTNDPAAASGGTGVNQLAGMTIEQANVAGILVRSGYDPTEVLKAAGAPAIKHTGLLPVTLKDASQIDAEAEAAKKKADAGPADPAAATDPPSGADPGEPADDNTPDPAEQPA